ncbi:MAG: hypothetical protein R3B47_19435 [Bacteroidia bacterium]
MKQTCYFKRTGVLALLLMTILASAFSQNSISEKAALLISQGNLEEAQALRNAPRNEPASLQARIQLAHIPSFLAKNYREVVSLFEEILQDSLRNAEARGPGLYARLG